VGCALLAVAGVIKALRPHDSALALKGLWPALSVRRAGVGVRLLATLEAGLGAVGIAFPNAVVASLVAASYAGFVVVVLYARSRGGPLATCGCFGSPDTPPTVTHAAIDAVVALAAALYGASGQRGNVEGLLSHQYFHGVPLVVAVALCGWLAFVAMVQLPRLGALTDPVTGWMGGRS
jgi:hypothetical protein